MNRLILLLIGLVLVGIAGFALVWFGVGRELHGPSTKVLSDLHLGKYADVHAAAHESFRKARSVEDLQAYWTWWTNELGAFYEVVGRRGVSTHSGTKGSFKGLTLELGFMKAKAIGTFRFDTSGDAPILTHFRIGKLDEGLGKKDDRSGLEGFTRELFDRYDAEDWAGLYARIGFDLQQAWPLGVIQRQMPAIRSAMGKVQGLRLTKTEDGAHDDVVVQHYEVAFENGAGEAKVSHKHDGRWEIVGFVIK